MRVLFVARLNARIDARLNARKTLQPFEPRCLNARLNARRLDIGVIHVAALVALAEALVALGEALVALVEAIFEALVGVIEAPIDVPLVEAQREAIVEYG